MSVTLCVINLILIMSLTFKGLTPILGSAAASCTRRQSCTEDEDEANTDDQMTAGFSHLIIGIGLVLILGAALPSGARCDSRYSWSPRNAVSHSAEFLSH